MFPQQPPFVASSILRSDVRSILLAEENIAAMCSRHPSTATSTQRQKLVDEGITKDGKVLATFEEEPSMLAHVYTQSHRCRIQHSQVPHAAAPQNGATAVAVPTTRPHHQHARPSSSREVKRGGRDTQSVATYLKRFENYSYAQLQRMKRDEEEKEKKAKKAAAQKRLARTQVGSFNHRFLIQRERSVSPNGGRMRSLSPHEAAVLRMNDPQLRQETEMMHSLRANARAAAFIDDVAPSDLKPPVELLRVFLCHLRGQSALPFVTGIRYYSDFAALALDGHELMTSVCPYFTKILEKHESKLNQATAAGFAPESATGRVLDAYNDPESPTRRMHPPSPRRRFDRTSVDYLFQEEKEQVHIPPTTIRIFPVILDSHCVSDMGDDVIVHRMPAVAPECEERDVVAVFMLPPDLDRKQQASAAMSLSSSFTQHNGIADAFVDKANVACTMRDGTLCNPWEASFIERTRVAFFKGQKPLATDAVKRTTHSVEQLLHEATLTAKTRSILRERRKQRQNPQQAGGKKSPSGEQQPQDVMAVPSYEECHFSVPLDGGSNGIEAASDAVPRTRRIFSSVSEANREYTKKSDTGGKRDQTAPPTSEATQDPVKDFQHPAAKFLSAAKKKFAGKFEWGTCFLDFTDLLAIQTMTNWYMLTEMNK